MLKDPRDKFTIAVLAVLTLALLAWLGGRWLERSRQRAERETFHAPPPAAGPAPAYRLPEQVTAHFRAYGDITYDSIPLRSGTEYSDGIATIRCWGYEPRAMPWLQDADRIRGRFPAVEVREYEFADDTSVAVFLGAYPPPGYAAVLRDPRGAVYGERRDPGPLEANVLAWVGNGRRAWLVSALDDRIGLQAVVESGFAPAIAAAAGSDTPG